MRNAALYVLRTPRLKTTAHQRNRRERPMCRSAPERTELSSKKKKKSPAMSFRPERKRSGGIHYVAEMYQHKIKLATWEDSSAHYRSLGMTCRGVVPVIHTGYNCHAPERHIGRSLQ